MKRITTPITFLFLVATLWACGGSDDHASHDHAPGDGHEHDSEAEAEDGGGHAHAEVHLGSAAVGGMTVELAQGHGVVVAGEESHLVVKLPYNDKGASIVRAWIGTADRLSSYVGKGEYAPDHDDYDVHATAPSPLPRAVKWWVEVEKPDGSKHLGSIAPKL
jgi:hypothetical protein